MPESITLKMCPDLQPAWRIFALCCNHAQNAFKYMCHVTPVTLSKLNNDNFRKGLKRTLSKSIHLYLRARRVK